MMKIEDVILVVGKGRLAAAYSDMRSKCVKTTVQSVWGKLLSRWLTQPLSTIHCIPLRLSSRKWIDDGKCGARGGREKGGRWGNGSDFSRMMCPASSHSWQVKERESPRNMNEVRMTQKVHTNLFSIFSVKRDLLVKTEFSMTETVIKTDKI